MPNLDGLIEHCRQLPESNVLLCAGLGKIAAHTLPKRTPATRWAVSVSGYNSKQGPMLLIARSPWNNPKQGQRCSVAVAENARSSRAVWDEPQEGYITLANHLSRVTAVLPAKGEGLCDSELLSLTQDSRERPLVLPSSEDIKAAGGLVVAQCLPNSREELIELIRTASVGPR